VPCFCVPVHCWGCAELVALKAHIKDGSLFEALTGASFRHYCEEGETRDVVRMSPRAMAHQIEQLREIAAKSNSDNKRLAGRSDSWRRRRGRLADELARDAQWPPHTERSGLADSLSVSPVRYPAPSRSS